MFAVTGMQCKKCGGSIPSEVVVDRKRRLLKNRTHCLICVPFGASPYSRRLTREEHLQANAVKQRQWRKKKIEETGVCPIRARRQEKKAELTQHIGGCQVCGYSVTARNLVFHHIENKQINMTERAFQRSWPVLLAELAKCILLCANHHGELHSGIIAKDAIDRMHADMLVKLSSFKPDRG